MSRTKRNAPKAHHHLFSNEIYWIDAGSKSIRGQLSKGGWKEAKRVLERDKYSHLRKKQGDCFSKYVKMYTPTKYCRKQSENKYRTVCHKEIQRYLHNEEHDVVIAAITLVTGNAWF